MDNKPENQGKTWFWRWFLDNQLVSGLLILSLLLINLILFSQTSYLFNPLKDNWSSCCLWSSNLLFSKTDL